MKKLLINVLLLFFFVAHIKAQNWGPAGISILNYGIDCIYTDTVNDYLYVSGNLIANTNDDIIYRYNGNTWDTIGGGFTASVYTVSGYNGELIAQGPLGVASFDGTTWHPFGIFNGTIFNYRVINGELYACGVFTHVDSINVNGIAKWNGLQWIDVYNFPCGSNTNPAYVDDVVMYNNNIYVGGTWDTLGFDLAVYKNGSWQQVGQGLHGGLTGISYMLVYKNELYVAGCIVQSAGNVGNGIQKWNDTIWTELGTSLQDTFDTYNGSLQVEDMKIHDNLLYVCGTFYYAGNVPSYAIAQWNGTQWCGFGASNFLTVGSALGFYHDTLFLASGTDSINHVYVDGLIKWIGGSYTDSCSSPTGIKELANENLNVLIYPSPTNSILKIHISSYSTNETIQIIDVLGEDIYKGTLSGIENSIDVSTWSAGVYFYEVKLPNESNRGKFIIQK